MKNPSLVPVVTLAAIQDAAGVGRMRSHFAPSAPGARQRAESIGGWNGTSRIRNKAARRKANARSLANQRADARRAAVAG